MATMLGISRATLLLLENGRGDVPLWRAMDILRDLGIGMVLTVDSGAELSTGPR
jgi:DNA-binding XRE family transcriptional regulator